MSVVAPRQGWQKNKGTQVGNMCLRLSPSYWSQGFSCWILAQTSECLSSMIDEFYANLVPAIEHHLPLQGERLTHRDLDV
jgi:hypothetical protein